VSQPAGSPERYNEIAGTSLDRLKAISDGIFSVAMTLLVLGLGVSGLGLHPTEGELWGKLVGLAPNVLIYTMSFMTLGIFWVGQGVQLGQLARSNRHFTWLQLAVLFTVTLLPFSTSLLANYHSLRVALVEYWLNLALFGFTALGAFEYGWRAGLFGESSPKTVARLVRGRVLIAQALYAFATALSIVFPTWVSIALIVLVQLNYVIAPRIPILHRY
jgi:uncharacterized membrane protein